MTLHRANPAALRHDDRDGLPLDHGFQRDFPCRRCFLYRRAAAAKLRLRTITFSQRCQVFLEPRALPRRAFRSEEHTSELQSLMRISYAVFCLKKNKNKKHSTITQP